MTMSHIARSFRVSLSVEHPHLDPAEITGALGRAPARAVQAGAPRTTPRGAPLAGTYPVTHWQHRFDVGEAANLGDLLRELLEQLQPHRAFPRRVVRERGAVELFCGVFADGNWDECLDHELLGWLADLRIDLRLDVYPQKRAA